MTKLTKEELAVWRQYSKLQGSRIHRCKVNQLEVHMNATREHEIIKFRTFWDLRK